MIKFDMLIQWNLYVLQRAIRWSETMLTEVEVECQCDFDNLMYNWLSWIRYLTFRTSTHTSNIRVQCSLLPWQLSSRLFWCWGWYSTALDCKCIWLNSSFQQTIAPTATPEGWFELCWDHFKTAYLWIHQVFACFQYRNVFGSVDGISQSYYFIQTTGNMIYSCNG